MGYRLGHHIIKVILTLIFLSFNAAVAYCNVDNNIEKSYSEFISLTSEQEFWKNWISKNDDNTCPLAPFILSYTQAGIIKFEKEIQKIAKQDYAILFIRISIDNGILNYLFLSWNEDDRFIKSIYLDGAGDQIITNISLKNYFKIIQSLQEISNHSIFVDTGNRNVIDATTIYLSLWNKGRASRFAIYNPKFEEDYRMNIKIPFLFLNELLNTFREKEKNR
ncbi:MAG: hypothetical protein KKA60_00250 [Proteobacteria bacterium]|nr:hypothetical protein [Pseudomonadota bacterium]